MKERYGDEAGSTAGDEPRANAQDRSAQDDMMDRAAAEGMGEWPEPPEPSLLGPELLPVPAFDEALLPDTWRPWIVDIADRMQAPPDFPAASAVVAAGGLIGRRIGIAPQDRTDWVEVPNLWGGIVGRPSVMKSPTMAAAFTPVRKLEVDASNAYTNAKKNYAKAMEAYTLTKKVAMEAAKSATKDALQQGKEMPSAPDLQIPEPEMPLCKRYLLEDATYEKAGVIMAENPDGIIVMCDELVGFMKPLGRQENATARTFWLKSWNGKDWHTFDRIARGLIRTPCTASIFGGIQPAKLAAFLKDAINGGEGDDGLMQRFQVIVYPDVDPSWKDVDRWPNRAAKNNYSESLERLAVLQPISVGAVSDDFNPLPYLRFCPEALVLFQAWRESLEKELRSGNLHPALESHFAKYRKLVPCLALIFHLVDCPEGGPVSADAVLRALAWAEYLAAHAERIYGSVTLTERIGARQIWKHLAAGDKLPEVFAVRHIQQKGWAGLGNAGSIRAALEVLVDHGLVQMREVPASATGGRPAEQYRMNPRARDLI
jgi:hypothetical protein